MRVSIKRGVPQEACLLDHIGCILQICRGMVVRGIELCDVRSLRREGVNVAVPKETKTTKTKFATWEYREYTICVAPSSGNNYDGVGLIVRETT